ncbi:uncharacterized protein LOC121421222 [Lytechinus variegatus]|uniref:uncharacterized protein LOC121421222 n=1 Tax=Lytechinus variegatus TaxID=7654 RepID=UPI001BB13CB1|nr:uncharacterized protein LOC121421222 [Lytechinus variegatus]
MEIINTSTTLTSNMVVHVALKMLMDWSNKGGTRERLLAIAQAFHFCLADIAKGLACQSTYPFVISHGTIDRRGGKLTLDKLGIRPTVSIPEGTIPKGMGSTVTLRVSIRNTPRLPLRDDEVLVTPVIETSFTQELVKPATVVLPHCMGFNNDDSTIIMYTKTGPDEPDFTTNHMDSEGQLSFLSDNVIEMLADVIVEPRDAYSFGRHIGFSDSAVEQYLNQPDSLSKTVSRSGFVDMLSDWRRRVRPSEQIGEIHHSLNGAGLSYVTDTILHGGKYC